MKKIFSVEKGITMMTLVLTIMVMIVIMSVLSFYVMNSIQAENMQNMKADILEIESKALTYYIEHGVVPAYGDKVISQEELKKTKDKANVADVFNPNDGDEYALVNLELLNVVTSYDTQYYINTETLTVYAKDSVIVDGLAYARMMEKFAEISMETVIPKWEEECFERELAQKFEYNNDGEITGIAEEYTWESWSNLVVPAVQLNGEPVVGIQEGAFSKIKNKGIDTIKIPNTIKSVPEFMFGQNESIDIHNVYCDASGININAFSNFMNVEEIHLGPACVIPDGNADSGLFRNRYNLRRVWIDTKSIGTYAFAGCSGLQLVILNNKIINIPNSCFENCANLSAILTSSELDDGQNWPGYTKETIKFPDSLETIGNRAFYKNSSLGKTLDLYNNSKLKEIGSEAFSNTGISEVYILKSVKCDKASTFPAETQGNIYEK